MTLNAWIFGVVLLGGVVLVRTSLARRVIAVAALVVALVLLGVFWPTLSLHIWAGRCSRPWPSSCCSGRSWDCSGCIRPLMASVHGAAARRGSQPVGREPKEARRAEKAAAQPGEAARRRQPRTTEVRAMSRAKRAAIRSAR